MSEAMDLIRRTKGASACLSDVSEAQRNALLVELADALEASEEGLLAANAKDLARMERSNPLYDRLLLTPERLGGIAGDIRKVATLESPLGKVLSDATMENGLHIRGVCARCLGTGLTDR